MALLFIARGLKADSWVKRMKALDPQLDIRVWPKVGNADEIVFALSWDHPSGELKKYKNLKCIASLGVGVDHILSDPDLPEGIPVTRIVEPSMAQSMSEYVVLTVLNHCRQLDLYKKDQLQKRWQPRKSLLAADLHIGVMGLGQLGADATKKLTHLGFHVAGWSRTPKNIDGVQSFAGDDSLNDFLAQTNVLICLLPLTSATKGILNRKAFEKLPADAYLINVARGKHLVEQDLIDALETGRLSGACLDVFQVEPLPEDHPFWNHPKITVTPHISSLTYPKVIAPQIVKNYHRVKSGKPPLNRVDIQRGY